MCACVCLCVTVKEENAMELEALTAVTGGPAIPGVAAVTVEGAPGLAAAASVFTVTLRASARDTQVSTHLLKTHLLFHCKIHLSNALKKKNRQMSTIGSIFQIFSKFPGQRVELKSNQ